MTPTEKPKSGSIVIKSQWFQNLVAVAGTLAVIGGCGAYLRKDMIAWGDRMLDRVMENTSHKIELHEAIPAHAGMDARAGKIENGQHGIKTEVRKNTALIMQQGFQVKELQKDQEAGFRRQDEQLDEILERLPQ